MFLGPFGLQTGLEKKKKKPNQQSYVLMHSSADCHP
jgi:hypothetical protein